VLLRIFVHIACIYSFKNVGFFGHSTHDLMNVIDQPFHSLIDHLVPFLYSWKTSLGSEFATSSNKPLSSPTDYMLVIALTLNAKSLLKSNEKWYKSRYNIYCCCLHCLIKFAVCILWCLKTSKSETFCAR
jgi:hypothetical protein